MFLVVIHVVDSLFSLAYCNLYLLLQDLAIYMSNNISLYCNINEQITKHHIVAKILKTSFGFLLFDSKESGEKTHLVSEEVLACKNHQ